MDGRKKILSTNNRKQKKKEKKMKNLILLTILTTISAMIAFAQTSDEKAILKFIADYDQAYIKKDIPFLERSLAAEYTVAVDGQKESRTEILAEAKKANPKEKMLVLKSTNETLRIVGDVAVATGFIEWKSVNNNLTVEPEFGKELYTIVLEKRNGKWVLVSEHISSVKRDRKVMEAEVLKASEQYSQIIKNKDVAAMDKILSREYLYTNEDGKIITREEELAYHKSGNVILEMIEISDQKVRIIENNAAVETGIFKYKGTNKGQPYFGSGRYTATWMHRDGVWQIVADHTSPIK